MLGGIDAETGNSKVNQRLQVTDNLGLNAFVLGPQVGKELAGLRWLLLATWGVYPISYAFPMLGLDGADSFVYRQVGYSIADVLAKCLYGLLIFKIARIKSMDDSPEFADGAARDLAIEALRVALTPVQE